MWPGFDPDIVQRWDVIRGMVTRRRQTPTHEWPLAFVEEQHALLVVREWPDGELTAYVAPADSDSLR